MQQATMTVGRNMVRDGSRATQKVDGDRNLHFLIRAAILILIVAKSAALVLVTAMAIDQNVSTEGIFIL